MQTLQNRYQYLEKDFLGRGSFGRVYKGKDTQTGDAVAIKIMDMTLFDDQFMIDALHKEIAIMKQLQHPNIVRLVDTFGDSKQTVLIIELCDGGDLRHFLSRHQGMLDEVLAQQVLQQLMLGFQEMTKAGYIHRDIKPENSLIHKNIHKVADFGFATKADITGRQLIRDCVGTPIYMAPQLLQNTAYTAKCDIWSIGVMAYEMLYGRQPWPCRDLNSYLLNIKSSPLKFPIEKKVSEQFKDFIKKCLTIDENQRIGWNDVFKHDVLKISQNDRQYDNFQVDEISKQILANIQKIIQAKNLNLEQQFKIFDQDKGGNLDLNEFYNFIQALDSRVTHKEVEHLFKLVDKSGDQKVSIDEFKKLFCDYDYSNLKDVAERLIVDLKEIIKANNLKIEDIFKNFDKDQQGDLDFDEFTKLCRTVAPALKNEEIQVVFNKFDKNNDKKISFDEFKRELSYGTDQDSKFNPAKEKANKILSELVRIVKQNNLKIEQIFQNFDKNKNQKLELAEFQQLCKVMDNSSTIEEQTLVFQLVDKNQDNLVDFQEFAALFK
ncbi:unnamed protein product [Paramecium sonneborni]|uniref:Calcium-dependent protein kinase n=1 Tax=Paramecium sonneborni TaxID=65129 RepID=A0A8S1NZT9_9CILI|nr:unnamed protein product [Paramecium sonneborni]